MLKSEVLGFVPQLKKNPSLRVENAIEALGGSEALYEKLVRQVTRMIPSHIESMDSFLNDGSDLAPFAVKVHGIKGSLMQVGFSDLALTAESLEKAAKSGDRQFCDEHYGPFREDLFNFHKEIDGILQNIRAAGGGRSSNIADYRDALCQAQEAANDYDSMSAADHILPLTNVSFGEEIDRLVSEAVKALDVIQPEKALGYITELIKKCDAPVAVKPADNTKAAVVKKILVVDDNKTNLSIIEGILSMYKVYPVFSGALALKFLERQRPNLILLDVEMPEMSGIDLFGIIKSKPELSDIPVIFMTGNTDLESEVEAFSIGGSDYIRKPISSVIMLAKTRLHLELEELRKALAKTE